MNAYVCPTASLMHSRYYLRACKTILLSTLILVSLVNPRAACAQDLLVKLREGSNGEALHVSCGARTSRRLLPQGGSSHSLFGLDRIEVVFLKQDASIEEALISYRSSPIVEYAVPNTLYRILHSAADSLEGDQWNMELLDIRSAWVVSGGDSSVVVAIIDTGADLDHPDLEAGIWINREEIPGNGLDDDNNGYVDDWRGWDFVDAPGMPGTGDYLVRDNDPDDEGPSSHGTHVAGIVAATADNGIGVVGMAPGCKVMVLRAGFGPVGYLQEDDASAAVVYAVDNGARIINMSWGDVVVSPIIQDVLSYAEQNGCLLIAAAGNSGSSLTQYPSGYQSTMAVGATGPDDDLASFSSFGPTLEIVAPGKSIVSTFIDGYGALSGTSMAAPHVAGLAALIFSARPGLTGPEVRQIICTTAMDIGEAGRDSHYGWGRIRPAEALSVPVRPAVDLIFPAFDEGISGPVPIIGTAAGIGLDVWRVEYSTGEEPSLWLSVTSDEFYQVFRDTLCIFDPSDLEEGPTWLRVLATNDDGTEMEARMRLFIDRTPPTADGIRLTPMVEGSRRSYLLEADLSEPCRATLLHRQTGASEYSSIGFRYQWETQRMLLDPEWMGGPDVQFYMTYADRAGHTSTLDDNGSPFALTVIQSTIQGLELELLVGALPPGHLLPSTADLDNDGNFEVIMGELIPSGSGSSLGALRIFERTFDGFIELTAPDIVAYPRAVGDTDGNHRSEILLTYGMDNWLLETDDVGFVSAEPVWQGSGFWGGWLADMDGDGFDELLAVDSGTENALLVWRGSPEGIGEDVLRLTNPTPTPNGLTPPTIVVADIDRDGVREAVVGDSGGDLFAARLTATGLEPAWDLQLPLDHAFYLASGDFDGDGQQELVAATHSSDDFNSEHEYDARYWVCSFIRGSSESGDVEVFHGTNIYGVADLREVANGLGAGDIDGIEGDEVGFVAYPDMYVFTYDASGDSMMAVFHMDGFSSNRVLFSPASTSGTSFLIVGAPDSTISLTLRSLGAGPPPPGWIEARPLNSKEISVRWSTVDGAENYVVNRGETGSEMVPVVVIETTSWVDAEVVSGTEYSYAVSTVDSQATPETGPFSLVVSATPNPPPRLIEIAQTTARSLRLVFSEPMAGPLDPAKVSLLPSPGFASSVVGGEEGVLILASWGSILPEGEITLHLEDLRDLTSIPLADPTDTLLSLLWQENLYLSSVRCDGDSLVALTFSAPLRQDDWSVEQVVFSPPLDVEPPMIDADDEKVVILRAQEPLISEDGEMVEVAVEGFVGKNGEQLIPGAGSKATLFLPPGTLEFLKISPNPVIARGGPGFIFSGLPVETKLSIYDFQGRRIISLSQDEPDGILGWPPGDDVAGGVYFFRAEHHENTRRGKLVFIP